MRKFVRGPEPGFLTSNSEQWGSEWEQRANSNPCASFHWHVIDGVKINQRLLPFLKSQTDDHCSFCDAFPVCPPSIETVEHFRPKSVFHRDAYRWKNLYFACTHCQQKGGDFDEALLCPDAQDYSFDRYFIWDFTRGTVEVNPQAKDADRHRARVTIDIYRFNEGHPSLRKRELLRRAKLRSEPLVEFAYRHYLEPDQPN